MIVHLNRKKCGDIVLGEGLSKRIVLAIDLESLKRFASASFKKFDDKEPDILLKFKGVPGFAQIHHSVQYEKKETASSEAITSLKIEKKKRILLEFYNESDLFNRIKQKPKFSLEDTKQIFEDLIGPVAILHREGILHRDLKLENVFLERKTETSPLHAVLGDFGFACELIDITEKNNYRGTISWLSPEYIEASLATLLKTNSEEGLIDIATTKAHDIWGLGLILSIVLKFFVPTWMITRLKGLEISKAIQAYIEPPEPTENSPEHLVWRMIRKDPSQRISADAALAKLSQLQWPSTPKNS